METNTTDTPRTDAKYKDHEWDIMDHIPLEFCRQLEKEQAALRKEVAVLRKENAELKQGKVFVDPKWICNLETQLAKAHEEVCEL